MNQAQVDPSVELPISHVSPEWAHALSCPEKGQGSFVALSRNGGVALAVELRCVSGDDPPPWIRVEIGLALQRAVVCEGAEFVIPEVRWGCRV